MSHAALRPVSSRPTSRALQRGVAGGVLFAGAMTVATTVLVTAAQAGGPCGTGYPYAGAGGATDPNGFFAPDMRSYVAACLNANGSDFARTEKGPNGGTATFGEPTSWDVTASSIGFAVTSTPVVGLVAQLHTGEPAPLFDSTGKPSGTLRGGDVVGYVDAVYTGNQALVRTYDASSHAVRTLRMIAPRYLRLAGGKGIRGSVTPTKSASPTPKPSPSATPTRSPSPTPSPVPSTLPTPTNSVAAVSPSPAPASSSPVVVVKAVGTSSKSLASRYGKLIGIGGVIIAVILGIIVIVASRRTDDIGD